MKTIYKLILITLLLFIQTISIKAYEKYNIGDKITYNGVNYYVIENSGTNRPYITLLKETPISSLELENNLEKSIGLISYSKDSKHCINGDVTSGCSDSYNETEIKNIIENWSNSAIGEDNLIKVDNYKVRLLNSNDLTNLGYLPKRECSSNSIVCDYNSGITVNPSHDSYSSFYQITINGITYHSCESKARNQIETLNDFLFDKNCDLSVCEVNGTQTGNSISHYGTVNYQKTCNSYSYDNTILENSTNYEWINYNNVDFWTMKQSDNNEFIYTYNSSENVFKTPEYSTSYQKYDSLAIRPVINFKKTSLGSKSTYEIGDEIVFKGEKYYVIENSNSSKNYVTVLKYVPLLQSQLTNNNSNESAIIQYYVSDQCNSPSNISGCINNFNESKIKEYLDIWTENNIYEEDLIEQKGLKVRLLSLEDLLYNLGYKLSFGSANNINKTEDTPKWIYNYVNYWTLPSTTYLDNTQVYKVSDYLIPAKVFEGGLIRPVIYLSKCALGDKQCEVCDNGKPQYKYVNTTKTFKKGEIITYKDEQYYVMQDSNSDNYNLQLLKINPLSDEQLNQYNENSFIHPDEGMPYYQSYQCHEYDPETNSYDDSNCKNNYNESDVKKIIDKWIADKFNINELLEVDGYKSRILNIDELVDYFGFEKTRLSTDNFDSYIPTEITPEILLNKNYWTMSVSDDFENQVLAFNTDNNSISSATVGEHYNILPVININKCSLEEGCGQERILLSCEENIIDDNQTNETIVNVDNTLSTISKITLIISFILVIGGAIIIIHYYRTHYISKKN